MKSATKRAAKALAKKPSGTSKRKEHVSKPEILAPAGSLECFHAALEAGADAVYLGLTEHNARMRAKNFTAKTLSYVVPYAHKHKVKVQVALNTLVKQQELRPVLDTLYQLEQIGIDALIVQDLGLAHIARTHFPKLALHASTQMAIHNTLGVRGAEAMGFERVILARELAFEEIRSIRNQTALELEVFVHGALCYCISGLCLASSYLGGMSGNRGRCTQVCRRRFAALDSAGFYFSPKDLSLIDKLPHLARIGINSLKIEGRMKSAEYVHTVVSAYRAVLDSPERIGEMQERLGRDFGREKTTLFFDGFEQSDIINPSRPSGTGLFIGTVTGVRAGSISIRTAHKLEPGDRVRFHGQEGFEGEAAKVADVKKDDFKLVVRLKQDVTVNTGDFVYLLSGKSSARPSWAKERIDIKPIHFSPSYPSAGKVLREFSSPKQTVPPPGTDRLFVRIDNLEWLYQLSERDCDGMIVCPEPHDVKHIVFDKGLRQRWLGKLIIALPPFIPQFDYNLWDRSIKWLRENGVTRWMCGHVGERHFGFGPGDTLYSGPEVWCLNRATQSLLKSQGFARFTYSLEDDVLNLKATANADGFFTVFALVPLFISRIAPASPPDVAFADSKGNRFFALRRNRLHYLVGAQPLCLTHRRDALHEMGIRNFVLDFSFCLPRRKYLDSILALYRSKQKLEGSMRFNYKAGLK